MKKTLINALCLFIAVLSGICLFILKYQVKEEERQLQKIHREILQNKREIHMLEAEWAHLNDPQRLLELVKSQTNWETVSADQISTLSDIPLRPELLPAAPEVIETAEEASQTEPEKQTIKEVVSITPAQTNSVKAPEETSKSLSAPKADENRNTATAAYPKGAVIGGVWKPAAKQTTGKSVFASKSSSSSKPRPTQKAHESDSLKKGAAALSTLSQQKGKR